MLNSTRADIQRQLTEGLVPHNCRSCATTVLVKKNSLAHTSVQWTGEPAASCPEFAAAGQSSALVPMCGRLRESIARAVLDGTIPVARHD
ncbi:hypothetical protein GCM10010174_70810 [Kutzneria viridogrisea]|uniref:Ferredoxin n=2 Tax=Kutzneria TaxID=43356 RepID=W5WBE3_9PSEU|nr:hypothetical protein [Kutzneria albida]AHH98488.1 hypothetical protein KALB_5126 [Kutzneria albida DSM 43870]MBA8923927.1 hypothetical protein [Kutzneria viridogrisea]